MNYITALLIGIFVLPILIGIFSPLSDGIRHTLFSFLKRAELLLAVLLSFFFARTAFSHPESGLWTSLYNAVPSLSDSVSGQDVWLFLIAALISLVFFSAALHLVEPLLLRYVLSPFFDFVLSRYKTMSGASKRVTGGIVQLPKSIALVLAFSLLFHFYIVYTRNTSLGQYIGQSSAYQVLDEGFVQPAFDSALAGSARELIDGLFEKAVRNISLTQLPSLTYFNGITLRDAVASTDEIDTLARELTAGITGDREKAYLLYEWICSNITYDFEKVRVLNEDYLSAPSGALEAYTTGSGVCFDFSCLYVSMCRAADIRVRFISGKGCSGGTWEAHAWNQIYVSAEDRWFNVDTTFGSTGGNYFDRPDFFTDHTEGKILGEW